MSNKNYAQVPDLLVQGLLRWDLDMIVAVLVSGAQYHSDHKNLSQLGVPVLGKTPIQGRWLGQNGMAMGLPASFGSAESEQEYQVIVAKDVGLGDPLVLSYLDQNSEGDPLTVKRSGTLIVRPYYDVNVQPLINPPLSEPAPTVGVWMVLG